MSSVGIGTDNHFQALLEGKNGIETLPDWAEEYPCKVGAPYPVSFVFDFNILALG